MRLIDADALLAQFHKDAVRLDGVGTPWDMSGIDLEIESSPTIDAVPVVHGTWVRGKGSIWTCSCCGAMTAVGCDFNPIDEQEFFCYHCGARMDGE